MNKTAGTVANTGVESVHQLLRDNEQNEQRYQEYQLHFRKANTNTRGISQEGWMEITGCGDRACGYS